MNEQNAGGVRQRPVEIVVPVYNEAHVLVRGIGRLHAYLETSFPSPFTITVADDASTDATRQAALAPHIEDTAWFLDAEFLVLAQRDRLRIHEVPVGWTDDPDSRVIAVPRRTRTTTPVLPVGAPASSAEHLEYAS
ncbi:glycosyltransferase [Streptomyces sp. NPDC059272]|uniref:glycosyltransferase n=1 Tax=Streptomyces sp. NPDC059272 TaxID=3346800 RepID=UPI0036C234DE